MRNRIKSLKKYISPQRQMSEAFLNSALLAVSGGFMDAYTYNGRNHVFANAETGNIVLMGQKLMEKDLKGALPYLISILAFALGIFAAENIRHHFKNAKKLHWRQGILAAEILILLGVGMLPRSMDLAANVLVAFTAALQVQAFRKVDGIAYASTMCTGNLRSGVDAFSVYLRERKREQLTQAGHYFAIILFFTIGAGLGGILTPVFGIAAIRFSCVFLVLSFILMSAE